MTEFELPEEVQPLLVARDNLRRRYASSGLNFTFDGNLVGDIGEAVAAELFGIKLEPRCGAGIDGFSPDPNPRSVQVKASGTARGPAFRRVDLRADHLLFFHFDFEGRRGSVVYNGPEELVLRLFPAIWIGQKSVAIGLIKRLNAEVPDALRLRRVR